MQTHSTMVRDAVVFLASAVVFVPISRKTGLGSILGYLAAGAIIGPWGLRLVENPENIMSFAELGVVFLLFLIGLELKPARLWAMRRAVFGLGGAQMAFTTILLSSIFYIGFGLPIDQSALFGFSLSLSSTAFALQLLSERNELRTEPGRNAFAILLMQDLAVIPLLAILPMLTRSDSGPWQDSLMKSSIAILTVLVVAFGGRYLVRPFFRWVAASHLREVFASASLLVVLGVSWILSIVGVSMALGAFLAGLVLSDSEYRHELEANIDAFKGLLLGLFFIAVGMSVDFGLLIAKPLLVCAWVLTLVGGKFIVLWALGRRLKFAPWISARFAATLSQGGEFAFVIATIAQGFQLIDEEAAHMLTLAIALSMAVTPLIMFVMDRMCAASKEVAGPAPQYDVPEEEAEVIIAGFGRVGQIVGRLLRMRNIRFTALEQDYAQVEVVRRFGNKVYFGDASRVDLLEAAKAHRAKYFFLCIDDVEASVRTAEVVQRHFPHLKIIARARNRAHVFRLLDVGVTQVFRETLASSVEMAHAAFLDMGYESVDLADLEKKFREFDEKMLIDQHKVYKDETAVISVSKQAAEQLAQVMQQDQRFTQVAKGS